MFAAKFPGSTEATAATNARPGCAAMPRSLPRETSCPTVDAADPVLARGGRRRGQRARPAVGGGDPGTPISPADRGNASYSQLLVLMVAVDAVAGRIRRKWPCWG